MEKFEKQLKKNVNETLPQNVDDRINATLQQLSKKKRFSKVYYGIGAAIATLFLTFGLSYLSPTFADTVKTIPVIGSVFEKVGNIGVKKANEQGLTTLLGEQIEVNGQRITFTESLYDGAEIHLGYIMETIRPNHAQSSHNFLHEIELMINGRSIGGYGMGARDEPIGDGSYVGTMSIRVTDGVPDSFMLGIRSREGSIEIPVERQGEYESYLANQTKETNDLTMFYDKITFFPTSTEISFRKIIDEDRYQDDTYMHMDYQLIDNEGRVLQPLGGGGGGGGAEKGKFVHSFQYYFEPLDSVPTTLTVKPFLYDRSEKEPEIVKKKWDGSELVLSQGEIGQLTIVDVMNENGVATFTYRVDGEDFYQQAISIWLEDSDGNRYDTDQPPKRMNETINQYQASFSSVPNSEEGLYICTAKMSAPKFLKELEVTIELGK
ncbi:DUF4179 domain-containing protein [bacterium LRH843]|nr:DUF4179 domain-containing protein [bacterium LRH843]